MEEQPDLTFEQAMQRLEEVVQLLEDGNRALDESLRLFEEGVRLARECSRQLTDAQGRLEMLAKSSDGSVESRPHEL